MRSEIAKEWADEDRAGARDQEFGDPDHDEDHLVIWLAPVCEGGRRAWCQNDVWTTCACGGKHKPVRYIRRPRTQK